MKSIRARAHENVYLRCPLCRRTQDEVLQDIIAYGGGVQKMLLELFEEKKERKGLVCPICYMCILDVVTRAFKSEDFSFRASFRGETNEKGD